jgi:ribA/ribD-fused uncharacterized protein
MIDSFKGEHRWLSNFWPTYVMLDGELYASVEHAYVAAKFPDNVTVLDPNRDWLVEPRVRTLVKWCSTAGKAKKLGQKYKQLIRPDWKEVRLGVMESLLRQKFDPVTETADEPLAQMLLDTGDVELVEGNVWHDNFWGNCTCSKCPEPGENHLGKLLMKIRSEL